MPKKTKKEKLLALYHKKLSLLENRSAAVPVTVVAQAPRQTPFKKQADTVNPMPVTSEEKQLNKYFLSDLKKSLILITVIIGLEISLYALRLVK